MGGILLGRGSVVGAVLVELTVPFPLVVEDDSVTGGERGDLCLGRGIRARSVCDVRQRLAGYVPCGSH